MRLEEYWGIGPKTASTLESAIGTEEAVRAIETGDLRTLVDAGVPSGRATRILRRATGGRGLTVLATGDSRATYRALLEHVRSFAVNQRADDRIRLLTPLLDPEAIESRQDRVESARATWRPLDEETRAAILSAFDRHADADSRLAALGIAGELVGLELESGLFAPLADLDAGELRTLADAVAAASDAGIAAGVDDELDTLRADNETLESLLANPDRVIERIRSDSIAGSDEFRESFVEMVVGETSYGRSHVRELAATDAADARDFVARSLRSLSADRADAIDERRTSIEADVQGTIEAGSETIAETVSLVEELGQWISIARFAEHFDLVRPTIDPDRRGVGVRSARNLTLLTADEPVQPITYGVGDHAIDGPPAGDRVTVLTGANSGGKTTLLETLCQVAILAQMGLPVPAAGATTTVFESIVFHRRHASFNAGVLESTLRTIVPPVAAGGRTLMLVDEFEAITEPGSAADLLHGLVTMTVDREACGVYVTHLAEDLKPLPRPARIDGIFAEGLTDDRRLDVDYQPRFGELGRSTPEFIVARLVAETDDRTTRAAYESLAADLGRPVLQRTLTDPAWGSATTDR